MFLFIIFSNEVLLQRKNPSDGFFVTAVYETLQSVRGIRCKGSMYPSFTPRPNLSELPIEPLFIEMATEKSQLEANLFTWSTLRVENVEKKSKETALKTFAVRIELNDLFTLYQWFLFAVGM